MILFVYIFWYTQPDDGCFLLPEHVAVLVFSVIKVYRRRNRSLLFDDLQAQRWRHTLKQIFGQFTADVIEQKESCLRMSVNVYAYNG